MVVGRVLSYWEGNFSGAMLNFRGVRNCRTNLPREFGREIVRSQNEPREFFGIMREPNCCCVWVLLVPAKAGHQNDWKKLGVPEKPVWIFLADRNGENDLVM